MRGDTVIEHGAEKLAELSERAEAEGGVKAKLAGELAEDAVFLRKLKPSLIVARARSRHPVEPVPDAAPAPHAKSAPKRGFAPNPFIVAAGALAVGILMAKAIDWRGHAHPRA
jgi:hypothetical protein